MAKDIVLYDQVARDPNPAAGAHLPVRLTLEEKRALRRERDVPFSERGMGVVIFTVSLAAFLQGTVTLSYPSDCWLSANNSLRLRPVLLQRRLPLPPRLRARPGPQLRDSRGLAARGRQRVAMVLCRPGRVSALAAGKLLAWPERGHGLCGVAGLVQLCRGRLCKDVGAGVLHSHREWNW